MLVFLRDYADSDYEALMSLWREAGLFSESLDKRYLLRRKIESSPRSIVLAEDNGRIVGSVAMVFDPWISTVFRLTVSKDYRNKSLGKGLVVQLIEEAEKRVKEIGAESVGVYVNVGRGSSRERGGYHLFGTYDCLEKKL